MTGRREMDTDALLNMIERGGATCCIGYEWELVTALRAERERVSELEYKLEEERVNNQEWAERDE